MLLRIIALVFLCLVGLTSYITPSFYEDQDIANIIKSHGVEGTMAISSLENNTNYIHNKSRANKRLSPASTFKIPHSLIAIDSQVLNNQYEKIKWDGEARFLDSWNKDQNLQSAFKSSCVWFFQKIASMVCEPRYKQYLYDFHYGNQKLGRDITTFWLDGSLKISLMEQIDFLKSVYREELHISKKSYKILKKIMLEEENHGYKIYSKTGASTKDWKGHGWYVGYIITKNGTFFFATNIDINGFEDLDKRKKVTIAALKRKGII
jgi:beta-lactamase class D